jgi:predicted metal-dependent peptidase
MTVIHPGPAPDAALLATEAKRMARARMRLVMSSSFFGSLIGRLDVIPRWDIPTLGVNNRAIYYNPAYTATLPMPQLIGVNAHEVMHPACGHTLRKGTRDHDQFNIAADYAINPILIDAGFELPEGALIDPQYDGMSAEQIYSKRVAQHEEEEPGKPGDFGGCGSFEQATDEDGKPLSEAEAEAEAREWQTAVAQAVMIAKRTSNLPGKLAELFDKLHGPAVDWREQLRRFMASATRQDYQWIPPNRRHIANGLYLPSLVNDGLGEIVFAVDTSVSMSSRMLQCAVDELNSIIGDVQPERVHVMHCDSEVRQVETFEPTDYPITVNAKGRGGTKFRPVFERVAELGITPVCLIYFTDLQCSDFGPEPEYPVLWASTSGGTHGDYWAKRCPFGEVINVVIDGP